MFMGFFLTFFSSADFSWFFEGGISGLHFFSEVLRLEFVSVYLFLCGCCWELQMWPDLIQKAKDGGLDVIQTYVFWNGHEPSPGQVNAS